MDVKTLQKYGFIVLNLEKFWKRLCKQTAEGKNNHTFVRRGVVGPKTAECLLFYVTHPTKEIQGYADFIEQVTGDAKELWESLGHESLLNSYDEYNNFLQGRKTATFIRFKNLKVLPKAVPSKVMLSIIGKKRMPQMGMYITEPTVQQLLSKGGLDL